MSGPLLNYTTTVPVSRTVGEVTSILARAGAATVATTYEAGEVTGVSFVLRTPAGDQGYVLPVETAAVRKVLGEQGRKGLLSAGRSSKISLATMTTEAHAARVAWRIAKDWLEAQMALIEAHLATLDQVMLPYRITADGRTVYQVIQERDQLALEAGR